MDVRVQKLMEKSSYIRNVVGRSPMEMLSCFLDKIQFSVSDLEGEVVHLKMGENGQHMSFLSPMNGIEIMEYYMGGLDDIPGHSGAKALDNTMVIHYCNRGRAEISIDSGRYAYMRLGTLCIEWRQEAGKEFNFYDELYGGIEISISVDSISPEDERFLGRSGIDMDTLRKACEKNDQYYIGQCHERLRHAFDDMVRQDLMDAIIEGYDVLKKAGYEILPKGEYENCVNKKKFCAWMYRFMFSNFIGKLCIADHAMSAREEFMLLDCEFEKLKKRTGMETKEYDKLKGDFLNYTKKNCGL